MYNARWNVYDFTRAQGRDIRPGVGAAAGRGELGNVWRQILELRSKRMDER